jgi:hypothetical protein
MVSNKRDQPDSGREDRKIAPAYKRGQAEDLATQLASYGAIKLGAVGSELMPTIREMAQSAAIEAQNEARDTFATNYGFRSAGADAKFTVPKMRVVYGKKDRSVPKRPKHVKIFQSGDSWGIIITKSGGTRQLSQRASVAESSAMLQGIRS